MWLRWEAWGRWVVGSGSQGLPFLMIGLPLVRRLWSLVEKGLLGGWVGTLASARCRLGTGIRFEIWVGGSRFGSRRAEIRSRFGSGIESRLGSGVWVEARAGSFGRDSDRRFGSRLGSGAWVEVRVRGLGRDSDRGFESGLESRFRPGG